MSRITKFKKFSQINRNIIDHPKIKYDTLKRRKWLKLKTNLPSKLTDYGTLLNSKQVLRMFYGNIKEKKLRQIFKKSKSLKGDQILNFIRLLESRLDVVLFRLRFSNSFNEIHQMISHKHILVNGEIINSNGFLLNPGDHITINEKSFDTIYKNVFNSLKNYVRLKDREEPISTTTFIEKHSLALAPNYLEVNYNILEGIFLYLPTLEEIKYPSYINYDSILEYYKYKVKL